MTMDAYLVFAPEKPPEDAPCNGCGRCCLSSRCQLSERQFGQDLGKVCPALEWDGRQYRCGMVLHPSRYDGGRPELDEWKGQMARDLLDVGKHCPYPDELIFDTLSDALARRDPAISK